MNPAQTPSQYVSSSKETQNAGTAPEKDPLRGRAPTPRGTRAYMGLGVSNRCIILEYAVMNISMQRMFIAPLPIRSYVGLGMSSKNVVMNV